MDALRSSIDCPPENGMLLSSDQQEWYRYLLQALATEDFLQRSLFCEAYEEHCFEHREALLTQLTLTMWYEDGISICTGSIQHAEDGVQLYSGLLSIPGALERFLCQHRAKVRQVMSLQNVVIDLR